MWTYCQVVSSRLYCKDLFTPQYVWELLCHILQSLCCPCVTTLVRNMLDLCLPAFGRKLRTSVVTVPPADGWAVQHVMTNLRAFCKVTWSSQFVWLDILSYSCFYDYHWCSSVLTEWRFGKTADATPCHCLLWVVAWAEPLRLPLISLGHALTSVIQGEKGSLNIFFLNYSMESSCSWHDAHCYHTLKDRAQPTITLYCILRIGNTQGNKYEQKCSIVLLKAGMQKDTW